MKLSFAPLAAAAAALSACMSPMAPPPGAMAEAVVPAGAPLGPGECFRTRDIQGHSFGPDDRTILLKVNRNRYYRVSTRGSCTAGSISSDPIVTREPPGQSLICKPIDLDLAVGRSAGGGFPTPCIVDSITRLTPQEIASLPPRLRP